VSSLAVSPDGARLYATATDLHCWVVTGHVPARAWVTAPEADTFFCHAALSPDGARLAVTLWSIGRHPKLVLYDAASGERAGALGDYPFGQSGPLAWSPDGALLVALVPLRLAAFGAADGLRRWLAKPGRHAFTSLAFHPSGRPLLVGCTDGTARLYDPTSGRELRSFAWPLGKVRSVAFSPDGHLAAAGGDRGQVVVWDVDE
jgi:WD40 repeat protein